jgi:tetratricopeptide (TPR) repeat protein
VPASLNDQVGLYRSRLAGKRVLVVLDNARDADQVRPLLPGAAGCLVIVTSRLLLSGLVTTEGAHPLVLDLLTADEARELLAWRLGVDRTAAEPAAIDEIIVRCARLPLALSIAAARAAIHARFPLDALAGELRESQDGLAPFTGDDATTDVRAVFSWSYQRLSAAAATLFRLLGLQPGPDIGAPAAASLAGMPVERALAELVRATLLTEHVPGRYTFHDLLRAYAQQLADTFDSPTERRDAVQRLLDHYTHTAHAAAVLLDPHRDPVMPTAPQPSPTSVQLLDRTQAQAWFTAEHQVLLAAIRHAVSNGFDTHAWRLAWCLVDFLDWQGHWHDFAASQLAALDAARRLSDGLCAAHAHRRLGNAYTQLGQYEDAQDHLDRADQLYRELGDALGRAHTLNDYGWVYGRQNRYERALRKVEEALAVFRAAGHAPGQANALNNIGWLSAQLGDYERGIDHCRQALSLTQEIGDRSGEAAAWDSLGYTYHGLHQYREAAACFGHALELWRQLSDRGNEAEVLTHLGDTHAAHGDADAARDAWQRALAILEQLDHPEASAVREKLAAAS